MANYTRRSILAAGAVGGVMSAAAHAAGVFGNPDMPAEGAINASKQALADPGPNNPALANNLPSFVSPPPTDVNGLPVFWSSFNIAPKRIQAGGWARQVTTDAFPISTTIAGVNMRLEAGGIRELHWHQQDEWAVMTYGNCRITVFDAEGHPYVEDLKEGDLWYFPGGAPHSLQGLGPDGAEFVLAFDNGAAGEYNTLMASDWMAHTPPEVLAKNFGLPEEAFKNIPLTQRWIFPGKVPGPLADVKKAIASTTAGAAPYPFVYRLSDQKPSKTTKGGEVRVADSTNFLISKNVAAALITVRPGGLREMHWHPNADEWQYYLKGEARMTVVNVGPAAVTADFRPGDIGYVQKNLGHYVENTGTTDLVFMEIFRADRYQEVSLSDWLAHTPVEMVAATYNLDPQVIAQFHKVAAGVVPV